VLKVMRDQFGVAPTRLSAVGYADQRPLETGADDASLARNRRVEIVVVAGPNH
jgi:chemotaxis protein MotB